MKDSKINIAIDENPNTFIIDITIDTINVTSTENNEKDKEFINKLKELLKEYGC